MKLNRAFKYLNRIDIRCHETGDLHLVYSANPDDTHVLSRDVLTAVMESLIQRCGIRKTYGTPEVMTFDGEKFFEVVVREIEPPVIGTEMDDHDE